MDKEVIKQLKYDFDCKVSTVYRFLEEFSVINGERSVFSAIERYLDERNHAIVPFSDVVK